MRSLIISFIAFSLLLSCDEPETEVSNNYVVEGFIIAGQPVNNIKVKQISPLLSEDVTSEPITNAQVIFNSGVNAFNLDFNATTGLYEYEGSDLDINIGESYSLQVTANDRTSSAMTTVPDAPTGLVLEDSAIIIPQIRLSFSIADEITELFFEERIVLEWDSIPGESYYVVIEEQDNEPDPILPAEIPDEPRELLSSFRFISEPSESARFEIIGVALTNYGRYAAKVFTVNQEYVDLFDNLEQDSRDLNEPPSNIFNALGIFTSFAVDSIEFEVRRSR